MWLSRVLFVTSGLRGRTCRGARTPRLIHEHDVQRPRAVDALDARHLDVGGRRRAGDRRDQRRLPADPDDAARALPAPSRRPGRRRRRRGGSRESGSARGGLRCASWHSTIDPVSAIATVQPVSTPSLLVEIVVAQPVRRRINSMSRRQPLGPEGRRQRSAAPHRARSTTRRSCRATPRRSQRTQPQPIVLRVATRTARAAARVSSAPALVIVARNRRVVVLRARPPAIRSRARIRPRISARASLITAGPSRATPTSRETIPPACAGRSRVVRPRASAAAADARAGRRARTATAPGARVPARPRGVRRRPNANAAAFIARRSPTGASPCSTILRRRWIRISGMLILTGHTS